MRFFAAPMKMPSCSRALAWPTYSASDFGRSARSIASSFGDAAAGLTTLRVRGDEGAKSSVWMDMRNYRLGYDRRMPTFTSVLASIVLLCGAAAASAQAPPVTTVISNAWARPTVQGQTAGGGYLRIDNKGAFGDRLIGASSDAASSVELHSMTMDGEVMRMRRVEAIDVPAGGSVELKPGGLHLMLIGLKAPLRAGSTIPLTLRFEKGGEVRVEAKVAAPGARPWQHRRPQTLSFSAPAPSAQA